MVECPICFEEVEVHEITHDDANGQCCSDCAESFQDARDEYSGELL